MVKTSMTEAEAIEVIHKAMEFSISAITELDKSKEKIDMVGLAGEYYENKENCEREIAACMLAINALKEIQEYRAIGTVEEITKVVRFLSLDNDNGIIEDLQLLNKYQLIGTVEELMRLKESNLSGLELALVAVSVEKLKKYEAIGTVEEIKEILQLISEGQEDVDESGISTGLLHTLLEYGQYKKIGTVKECQEAREKQKAKKVIDKYMFSECPTCGNVEIQNSGYCCACGQRLD